MSPKHTPGPWRWQGEDYRGGWGWQMLVGPNGEGLIIGEANDGKAYPKLRAGMPLDPALCVTGLEAEGKEHAPCVHVFKKSNAALIAAAPELLEAAQVACAAHLFGEVPMVAISAKGYDLLRAAIAKAADT